MNVENAVALFRGVQRYWKGAFIVALSVAVVYLFKENKELRAENRQLNAQYGESTRDLMRYFQEKSDALQRKLDESNELQKEMNRKAAEVQMLVEQKLQKP